MKTTIGTLIRVQNKNRLFGSNNSYYAGWIRINGQRKPVQLTRFELDAILTRAQANPEDQPKLASWWWTIIPFTLGFALAWLKGLL